MTPYYEDDAVTIYHGDAFDILHDLSGVGAVVTDPRTHPAERSEETGRNARQRST